MPEGGRARKEKALWSGAIGELFLLGTSSAIGSFTVTWLEKNKVREVGKFPAERVIHHRQRGRAAFRSCESFKGVEKINHATPIERIKRPQIRSSCIRGV